MVLAENANTGSNRGHQVAINGFIASVLIVISFGLYFLWAFLPVEVLDVVLQSYYPDKYWATALPSVLIMSVIYYLAVSFLLMLYRTDPLTDGFCVASTGAALGENHCLDNLLGPNEDVPPIVDIPPAVTSRLLFQPWVKSK
ncbi:putative PIG P [Trypanosoma vivax]|uniref:PIG-P domain-containing protein n=1 Tax=Trypanosoma vivax (strain Y486) TaxID=1055687 RepID=G0U7U9_TRYVY|nr:hypothetical protein TRVL_00413 [Trypanosoma vivax]KAH8620693.1 putative PIG P [Trypanosoma vivax]CCC51957.1 conserved hypothetical protein [Trypanosoma vivax Y486]